MAVYSQGHLNQTLGVKKKPHSYQKLMKILEPMKHSDFHRAHLELVCFVLNSSNFRLKLEIFLSKK